MVIGLEVHAELATRTKMFSGAPNAYGAEPNTNIDPTTLGLPGSLPVLNKRAVELAIRLGIALDCTIQPSVFARKNYFYPDMPKDFQISQYDRPIDVDGHLQLPSGKRIGIERAHLEEDTGKSTHVGGAGRISGADYSLVDYNRAGVPLLEIVSRPDIASAEEARAYAAELRAILVATGVSDGKMEEGSMRVDANVSVHRPGEPLGIRCEIKNLNSLRSLGHAVDYEARRQVAALLAGETIRQETRLWNEQTQTTATMRAKEDADDYRYFTEPDLVPIAPGADWIAQIRASMPVLPAERRARLADAVGVAGGAAESIALLVERGADDLALAVIAAGAPADRALVYIEQYLADVDPSAVVVSDLAALVSMEAGGELTTTQARKVLSIMVDQGGAPAEIAAANGFESVSSDSLAGTIEAVIAANPDEWTRYREGDDAVRGKLTGFFVGQVMRATKGNADGAAVTRMLVARVES
ncbi:MAG: Asp-tRNA(Asn)/Glu-tRNA(Gln) amidotransferase subunit GatB [Actinobacteria bacterium]|nr:Asp-tRNA(Asn)/Glu-tRNA(Gln) amidotransferase subunit GatB [Actinomycetota bacterium]